MELPDFIKSSVHSDRAELTKYLSLIIGGIFGFFIGYETAAPTNKMPHRNGIAGMICGIIVGMLPNFIRWKIR